MLLNPLRTLAVRPVRFLAPHIRPGMRCLDYGCGPGFFTLPMARLTGPDGEVTAADIQPAMLELIRLRAGALKPADPVPDRVIRYQEIADGDPELSGPLDFALMAHVLHEVPEPARLLAAVHRALVPGGVLLLLEPRGHVSRKEWQVSLEQAGKTGFLVTAGPRSPFSRSVRLVKKG